MSIPSITKLVINENPPWLTNGNVIPVMGNARVIPPMLTRAWNPMNAANQIAQSLLNMSRESKAVRTPALTSTISAKVTNKPPKSPSSSARAAKM